jgi:hypothetical protein
MSKLIKAGRKVQEVRDQKPILLGDSFESIDPLVSVVRKINSAIDELENLKTHFTASGKARSPVSGPV